MASLGSAERRAFALKINRHSSAEIRRNFSGNYGHSRTNSNASASVCLNVPQSYEAVEPLDLEEFLMSQLKSGDSDLMQELGDFPEDDLKVEQVEKECRTIRHSVPENGVELDRHVRDCVTSYTQPWLVVSRRCQGDGWSAYSERAGLHKLLQKQTFESDVLPEKEQTQVKSPTLAGLSDDSGRTLTSSDFNLRCLTPDQRVEGLLAFSSPDELDRFNQEARQGNRHPELFALYPPSDEEDAVELRPIPDCPKEHSGDRILIRCQAIKFEIDIEPIFATMALYDLKEKKKISENFYCDMNSEQFRNFLRPHTPHVDPSSLARSAIFSITYPSPDIFLVIKLEKVLQQGEISDCADPYITLRECDSTKNKDKLEKLRGQAETFCQKLGRYRMPFAWATVNIMEVINTATLDRDLTDMDSLKSGKSSSIDRRIMLSRRNSERYNIMEDQFCNISAFKPAVITISTIFKQEGDRLSDEDLLKFLAEIKKTSAPQRRIKTISGSIKLDMSPIHDMPQACLSTELIPLIPVAEKNIRHVKEVLEFPSSEVYVPHNIYRNLLYVYPQRLNFVNRLTSARNITIKMQFMSGEDPSCSMPVIFGKSSGPEFVQEVYTPVTYHNKSPAATQVPLLLWSSDGSSLPPLPSSSAGHITTRDQLASYLSSAFGSAPHTVLLFLQDKLSKDDFTVYGGAFGNKQDSAFKNLEAALLQSSSSSRIVPALDGSGSASVLPLLQQQLAVSPVLVDAETLSHLSLNASVSSLLLLNLPYCSRLHKSCKEVLQDNDEIIGKVLNVMKDKNVPYTAIYTGLQPSRVIPELSASNEPIRRSLLQTSSSPDIVKPPITFTNVSGSPCIMLWAQNLNVSFSGTSTDPNSWIDLATQTPSMAGSVCNGSYSLLVLSYDSGISLSFAMTNRFYSVSARNWFSLDTVELRVRGETAAFIGSRGVYGPAEYSFHCQSVTSSQHALLLPSPDNNPNTTKWSLKFIDFQIQGFGLTNGTNFSYANDCAGFFTAGIWMGLVTSLLMLFIFVYGLHMIMQVNTMDRFDDPKGPSISVPQTE